MRTRSSYETYKSVKRLTFAVAILYVITLLLFNFNIPYYQIAIALTIVIAIGCIIQIELNYVLERNIIICKSKLIASIANAIDDFDYSSLYPTMIRTFRIQSPESDKNFKYESKKHIEHILFIWPQFVVGFAMILGYIIYGINSERIHESVFTTAVTLVMFCVFIANMCLTFRTCGTNEFILTIISEFYGKGE